MSEVDEKEDALKKLIEALPPVKLHSCDLPQEMFLKIHISEKGNFRNVKILSNLVLRTLLIQSTLHIFK